MFFLSEVLFQISMAPFFSVTDLTPKLLLDNFCRKTMEERVILLMINVKLDCELPQTGRKKSVVQRNTVALPFHGQTLQG